MTGRALIGAGVLVAVAALWPRRAAAFALPVRLPTFTADPMTEVQKLIERHEGRVPYIYRDTAGIETFGVGHRVTSADGALRQYSKANPAPAAVIDALFERDARAALAAVDKLKPPAPLTVAQRAALASLAFNIGAGAFASSSVARAVNAGDHRATAAAFKLWNKARNPKTGALEAVAGLTARRADEARAFA